MMQCPADIHYNDSSQTTSDNTENKETNESDNAIDVQQNERDHGNENKWRRHNDEEENKCKNIEKQDGDIAHLEQHQNRDSDLKTKTISKLQQQINELKVELLKKTVIKNQTNTCIITPFTPTVPPRFVTLTPSISYNSSNSSSYTPFTAPFTPSISLNSSTSCSSSHSTSNNDMVSFTPYTKGSNAAYHPFIPMNRLIRSNSVHLTPSTNQYLTPTTAVLPFPIPSEQTNIDGDQLMTNNDEDEEEAMDNIYENIADLFSEEAITISNDKTPSDNKDEEHHSEPSTENNMESLLRHFVENPVHHDLDNDTMEMDHIMCVCGRDGGNKSNQSKPSNAKKLSNKNNNNSNNGNNNDSGSNDNHYNDGSDHGSNGDDDDDKNNDGNNENEMNKNEKDEKEDNAEIDRLIKVFMDLKGYNDESLRHILSSFSQKTVDKVFDGIQQLNAAKMRIQNVMSSSNYQSISFESKQNDKEDKDECNRNRSRYIPLKAKSIYQIDRKFTKKSIPGMITEHINIGEDTVYKFMVKSLHIHHYVEWDKRRIFNLGLHQKTNKNVYFIGERLNPSGNGYKWRINQILTKHEIICKYHIPSHKLPHYVNIEDLDETKEVEETLMKSKHEIIQNTNWNKIIVYNKRNTRRRMTLSLTKPEFRAYLKQFVDLEKDRVIIPIIMFGRNDRYWMEYVWIVSVEDNVDIGVSLEYNKSNNTLKVVGIHLDKELVFSQHQIISPSHCYSEFKKRFNSQITDIHIGNPDDYVNQVRALKKELKKIRIQHKNMECLSLTSSDTSTSDIHSGIALDESTSPSMMTELNNGYFGSPDSSSTFSTSLHSPYNNDLESSTSCSDIASDHQ